MGSLRWVRDRATFWPCFEIRGDKARRIGFEPGPEGDVSIDLYPDVEVRRTYFVAADVLEEPLAPDLIVMRQVLEHVPDPMVFLKAYRTLLSRREGGNGLLYIEVPSTNATIEKGAGSVISITIMSGSSL